MSWLHREYKLHCALADIEALEALLENCLILHGIFADFLNNPKLSPDVKAVIGDGMRIFERQVITGIRHQLNVVSRISIQLLSGTKVYIENGNLYVFREHSEETPEDILEGEVVDDV